MSLNRKPYFHLPLESRYGGETIVYPANLTSVNYPHDRIQPPKPFPDYTLHLEEDAFSSLIVAFLDKYLDRSLIPVYCGWSVADDDESPYEYYGDNLYAYSDVHKMLDEIKDAAVAIRSEHPSPIIDVLIRRINLRVFPDSGNGMSVEELLIVYKDEISDYYDRFCAAVISVMEKAPECEYLNFSGP